jgi:dihydroorotate dehydrogenase (fumarate)
MRDLRTTYLGLELRSPIVASSGPLTGSPDTAKRLEAAGAGAIVLPSLFEEDMADDELDVDIELRPGSEQFDEDIAYLPRFPEIDSSLDHYLATVSELKESVDIPVMASLNATTAGGWLRYAQLLAGAGADALELNVYRLVSDPERSAAEVEEGDIGLVADIVAAVDLPVAVKLSPYYTALPHFARGVAAAGAHGLVLFNRFYQPDVDVEGFDVVPSIVLSQPWELRLPLRWIAVLRPQLPSNVSLAATSGVETGIDVVKALLVGADVVMMTSSLLRHGPEHLARVEKDLRRWMKAHDYKSLGRLRGALTEGTGDPSAFERSHYLRTLQSWTAEPPLAPTSFDG